AVPYALAPGTYGLAASSAQFGTVFTRVTPRQGCSKSDQCSMAVDGVGSDTITDPDAVLEITAANEQCVVGRVAALKGSPFPEEPNWDGSFYALRCPTGP